MQDVFVTELGRHVLAPDGWSYNAVRIFADKYLAPSDCDDIRNAIGRVATFVSVGDDELAERLYHGMCDQRYAFNSPVYFNAGVEDAPQCSACFIQSVSDDMESILDLAVKEGKLFQYGSGTGTNLSALRGKEEKLSGGGTASGPVSFMKVYDTVAGIVKSGGKTRRAAKMQILDIDHPDIEDFIACKVREDQKARDLILRAGYDSSFDGEAYNSVFFQNANLSVRVTDKFMDAAERGDSWTLTARTTGLPTKTVDAWELLRTVAEAAWTCGDPGIQFHDTINVWHTCPQDGEIVASNPCSEYMFLGETACNLASLNLVKYQDDDFNIELFQNDIADLVTAMDNIVSLAGYPTPEIARGSHEYRTLGLGFTNLGLALMRQGMRYDTAEARDWAASVTALMHFTALRSSANLAKCRGSYPAYERNGESHMRVFEAHADLLPQYATSPIWAKAQLTQVDARYTAMDYGFRNAQVTMLAPTGTISFIMDALTTGIEPAFARRVTKSLVGGGSIVIDLDHAVDIPSYAVITADEISPMDHVRMMAACQPFLSGAISKTINLPADATVDDIMAVYVAAHKLGLKSLAVYRDGSKLVQPMQSGLASTGAQVTRLAERTALPTTRPAVTHKFSVGGHDGYVTVGLYNDGRPGEVFIKIAKEGSTISGLLDAFAINLSVGLQYGIPLEVLLDKHLFARFEPSGVTTNPQIPMAHSLVDYIARWMLLQFSGDNEIAVAPIAASVIRNSNACPDCGALMVRTGSCYSCGDCGYNGGCG